jgi:hypothetical protein
VRSSCQSKLVSTTIDFGIAGLLSTSDIRRSASPSLPAMYGRVLGSPEATGPSIAFAYGSISSLCGLNRRPVRGS